MLTLPRAASDSDQRCQAPATSGMPDCKSPFQPAAPQTSMDKYVAVRDQLGIIDAMGGSFTLRCTSLTITPTLTSAS